MGNASGPARIQVAGGKLFSGIAGVLALTLAVALIVGACGRAGKKSGSNFSKRVIALGQPVPKGGGVYKVGKPYQINGRWFHPREDASYDKVGVASWYGELFHGRYTANGEIYDMNALSAAHPTLPLPVYAKVTNLNNGRSLVVRVNDRGPYAHDRVIDMSKRSAELLGFKRNGTARVRVKYLTRAPLSGDDTYERQMLASQGWARTAGLTGPPRSSAAPTWKPTKGKPIVLAKAQTKNDRTAESASEGLPRAASKPDQDGKRRKSARLADPIVTGSISGVTRANPSLPDPIAEAPTARKRRIYVQSGAFKYRRNAEVLRDKLAVIGQTEISPVTVSGTIYHRVRLGPFDERELANTTLAKVVETGAQGASIISE
jgi:rare lipoprotein A